MSTSSSLQRFNDSVLNTLTTISELQKKELETFSVQLEQAYGIQ